MWKLSHEGYDKSLETSNENRFLVGNGYLGIRGSLEEYKKELLPAINLAGIYDKTNEGWREPLNAPNALYTYVISGNKRYGLPEEDCMEHKVTLDYRNGIFSRHTIWNTEKGNIVIDSERFTSMDSPHKVLMKYQIKCDFTGEIILCTGIDGDVWDIHGPHYHHMCFDKIPLDNEECALQVTGVTGENADQVTVLEYSRVYKENKETIEHLPCSEEITEEISEVKAEKKLLRNIKISCKAGETYELQKRIVVYTSKDSEEFRNLALLELVEAIEESYESLLDKHKAKWEELWRGSEVIIEGDDLAMEAINYSLYHLHSIAPRHSDNLSIAARGLSGQTYKGAVFWDTEMFLLDFFLLTEPKVAKSLIKYRINTLDGAKRKAKEYGYEGAFYAWESQEGGFDACSDYNVVDVFTKRPMRTYFKDKQVHISSAVVYGIMSYVNITKDTSVLYEGGAETIIECAIFYYNLLVKRLNKDYYEIHDVIGPDEYHERVNNNGYTNRMAKYTFGQALGILQLLEEENCKDKKIGNYSIVELKDMFQDGYDHIYVPRPDSESGVIEQFEGYFKLEDVSVATVKGRLLHEKEYWGGAYGVASHTGIIKQADVVTWLTLFSKDFDTKILWKNWEYYESRTEHGSSLSACMYALLACRCNQSDKAYPYFIKSATADMSPGGKEWAGLVYIGGTHPAAAGGAYMTVIKGFAGLEVVEDRPEIHPKLPSGWKKLSFPLNIQNTKYRIHIEASKEGDEPWVTKIITLS